MKRIGILTLLMAMGLSLWAQQWDKQKANAWYARQGWRVGANYIPATAINQLEMWQGETFDPKTIDKELGWAQGLGMNLMRVYLHHVAWEQDKVGFKKRLDQFLGLADKRGMKTLLVLFDDCWNESYAAGKQPEPKLGIHNSGWVKDPGKRWYDGEAGLEETLKAYVADVMGSFKNDQRIFLWDLYNEPGWAGVLDPKTEGKMEKAYELADKVFGWARQVNPSQPLSICVWYDGPKFAKLNSLALERSDIITYHNYQDIDKHSAQIGELKKLGRPLVCTEYMARKHNSTFASILPLLKKENVAAINWGLVAGKTNTIYAWDEKDWGSKEPSLWFHDIFRGDGRPYDEKEVETIRSLTGARELAKTKQRRMAKKPKK